MYVSVVWMHACIDKVCVWYTIHRLYGVFVASFSDRHQCLASIAAALLCTTTLAILIGCCYCHWCYHINKPCVNMREQIFLFLLQRNLLCVTVVRLSLSRSSSPSACVCVSAQIYSNIFHPQSKCKNRYLFVIHALFCSYRWYTIHVKCVTRFGLHSIDSIALFSFFFVYWISIVCGRYVTTEQTFFLNKKVPWNTFAIKRDNQKQSMKWTVI